MSYAPYALCAELLDTNPTEQSLHAILEECCGQPITRGQRTIEAEVLARQIADQLDIDTDLPVFKKPNICYLRDGTPVEHSIGCHHSDRSPFKMQLMHSTERSLPDGCMLIDWLRQSRMTMSSKW